MVARLADVEQRIEVGSLSARCQHGSHAAFECRNLLGYGVVGRVLQPCIEVSFLLQVEEVCHLFGVVILESRALDDRQHARVAVLRCPSCLYAKGVSLEFLFHIVLCFDVLFAEAFSSSHDASLKTMQR